MTRNPKVTALPNSPVNIPDTRDIWRSHWPLLSSQSLQVSLMPPGCDRWTRARRALQHLQKMPPRSQLSVITGGIEPNVCLQPCACHQVFNLRLSQLQVHRVHNHGGGRQQKTVAENYPGRLAVQQPAGYLGRLPND